LTGELLSEALAAALAIDDESDRVKALATLASQWTSDLLQDALAAAQAFGADDDFSASEVPTSVAPTRQRSPFSVAHSFLAEAAPMPPVAGVGAATAIKS